MEEKTHGHVHPSAWPMVDWKRQLTRKLLFCFQIFFGFGWGALPSRPRGFCLGGKTPPDPPLKRSFLTFDRGGQTGPPRSNDFFFGAADNTGTARTSGWTSSRTLGVVWLSPV